MTHNLNLVDKVCKYEMDPASIMEDTEQTQFGPQIWMARWMDEWTDGYQGNYDYESENNYASQHTF